MRTAHIRFREIISLFKRRWRLLVIPAVLVMVVCVIGAMMLPRKYESTTTMLVRPDQTLTSLSGYEMMAAFEEQLRNFNEIIYSRTFLQTVADSLGLGANAQTLDEKQFILSQVGNSIHTTRRGSDAFTITYVDSDPHRAKRAAEVIANMFIQTKIEVENRQNALTVQFLEKKVDEYRQGFETSTQSLVSVMRQNVDDLPTETRSLYSQIDEIERSILGTNARIDVLQEAMVSLRTLPALLRTNPETLRSENGMQPLLELGREKVPYSDELNILLAKYDESTRRYTAKYPEVIKLETQIVALLDRMRAATESEVYRLQSRRWDLEKRRSQIIEELKRSSVSARVNQDKESTYEINRKLYNEMQLKLEQARLTAEVGSRGASQYIILDPAFLPIRPTKPNRTMIVAGGTVLGFVLGIIVVIVTELLDTTLRTPRHVEIYNKPIIALLPDGRRQR
jgi:polysaccharide biosynthesis transport protein